MMDRLLRHKFLVVIWLVVFGIGGYAGYMLFFKSSGNENPYVLSNSSENSAGSSEETTEPEQPKQIGLSETTQDGDVEITVTGINCGETTIGTNQYAMDQAEGHFCRLNVQAKSVNAATANLPASQKLVMASGQEYKLDTQATEYAQEDLTTGFWYENINAGETVSGDFVFDIPAAMTPAKAILYGAEGSAGIEVTLE